ncbi:SAYSvFN domain-containing protein 1-like [Gigantopelta aegis]|uniref:SAYSvFN domain-containing protein 1-like n=1 Tax=Gigantopelta aegis TaxID=1735272 RepID=UPI001B88913A|nr:SAYSvFN domain-containing protein 1-like [Gigantopelta aegis]
MERQLADYRARKFKEHSSSSSWAADSSRFITSIFKRNPQTSQSDGKDTASDSNQSADSLKLVISDSGEISQQSSSRLITTERVLKVVLWFVLWAIFLELQFGAVYFVVSLLFIIYRTTRTGPKKTGDLSAYSVFNPNCERIDGTFTAEQFEKELRFGALSVH